MKKKKQEPLRVKVFDFDEYLKKQRENPQYNKAYEDELSRLMAENKRLSDELEELKQECRDCRAEWIWNQKSEGNKFNYITKTLI